MSNPPRIFICYAHADNKSPDPSKRWLDRLLNYLRPLERRGQLKAWSDQDIELGTDWDQSIQSTLEQAWAAVLLVSQDFMGSKYIYESEVPVLLKRAKERGMVIMPIILRPCAFDEPFYYTDDSGQEQEFSLKTLQAPNSVTQPLNEMSEAEQDHALLAVYKRLKAVIENPLPPQSKAHGQANPIDNSPPQVSPQLPFQVNIGITWQISLAVELFPTFDQARLIDDIVRQLSEISGDVSLREISRDSIDGCVVIKLKSTEAGYKIIESFVESGQLTELLGAQIENLRVLTVPSTQKRFAGQMLSNLDLPTEFPQSAIAYSLQQRLKLSQRLSQIPGPQFEEMLFALNVPKGIVAGPSAPQRQRVVSLLEWAESEMGHGLDTLEDLLESFTNPR